MKIIHITASYKPAYIYGGPIQSVGQLCEELKNLSTPKIALQQTQFDKILDEQELNIEVFTTTANGKYELELKEGKQQIVDGVPVTYFKRLTKDHSHFSPGLLTALSKVLRQANKDNSSVIIHIHAWWNLVSVLSCLVTKWHGISVVLSPRGMLTSYTQGNRNSFAKKIIHKGLGARLLKYCHIHATSEQEKAEILEITKPKSISVIPNLVNLQISVDKLHFPKQTEQFKLIFLSRIEEKKGLELLFDALTLLEFPWLLTIAGTGSEDYLNSLKTKAESSNLSKCINWVGQVNNQNKFHLIAEHDLLVLPSYNENFANVVVESLSVGTPVLISEKVGLAEYVKLNELGWICGLNPKSIQEQFTDAYHNQLSLKKIRMNAPEIIRNDFNDKILAVKYQNLYENILQLRSDNTIKV